MLVDQNLPPALTWQEKKPMCEGDCWCVERFVNGRLEKATNIIECKRIEDAIECNGEIPKMLRTMRQFH